MNQVQSVNILIIERFPLMGWVSREYPNPEEWDQYSRQNNTKDMSRPSCAYQDSQNIKCSS